MSYEFEHNMSSYDFAVLTGRTHDEVLQDIQKMLLTMPHIEGDDGFTLGTYATGEKEVWLNQLMSYRLAMRYNRRQQENIISAWLLLDIPHSPAMLVAKASRSRKA